MQDTATAPQAAPPATLTFYYVNDPRTRVDFHPHFFEVVRQTLTNGDDWIEETIMGQYATAYAAAQAVQKLQHPDPPAAAAPTWAIGDRLIWKQGDPQWESPAVVKHITATPEGDYWYTLEGPNGASSLLVAEASMQEHATRQP